MAGESASNGKPRAARTPNLVLRAIREEERGETRAQFAEALTRVALETGAEVYPDAKYIERLESGEITWPRPPYRNLLSELLGRPIGELGFTAPILTMHDSVAEANLVLRDAIFASGMEPAQLARKVGVDDKTVQRWISRGSVPHPGHRWKACQVLGREESELWPALRVPPQRARPEKDAKSEKPVAEPEIVNGNVLEVDDVERRELLKIFGSIAAVAPLASGIDRLRRNVDGAVNAPTTAADVEEWERVASKYSAESGLIAPARLLPDLLTDLDEAQLRLQNAPDSFREPMARVCGQLSALAAINLFNTGDERNSSRYWRTALRAIARSGDRSAHANLYANRAVFALYEQNSTPAATLTLSEDAINIADSIPCAGLANAYAARAMAFATLGESRASLKAVKDLSDISSHIPEMTSAANTSWGWSEQQLRFTESRVYAYSGSVAGSAKANEEGLSLVPKGAWLATSSYELNTAICMIVGGDPSEGARHIVRTFQQIPNGYRQSASLRQTAESALALAPPTSANTPAVSEARELLSVSNGAGAV